MRHLMSARIVASGGVKMSLSLTLTLMRMLNK